jgi:hypothetical protein
MKKLLTRLNLQYLALPMTYIIFAVGVFSRDIRLQHIIINRQPTSKEFSLTEIFCNSLPRCTRVGSEIFGAGLQSAIHFFAEIFHGNEVWHYFYLTEDEYFEFFYGFSSLLFRIICVTPLFIYVGKLFTSNRIKIITFLALTSIISGYPLFYLNTSLGIYLVNYDYMVILVMSMVLIFYRQIFSSNLLIFVVIFFCTIVYEHLGFLIICSIFFLKKGSDQFYRIIQVALGAVILSLSFLISGYFLKNGFKISNESDGRYFQLNLEYWWKIAGAIVILIIWGLILGTFVGFLSIRMSTFKQIYVLHEMLNSKLYHGMFFGYLITLFVAFFVSGLLEVARQFLFLQVLSFFYGISLATRVRRRTKN